MAVNKLQGNGELGRDFEELRTRSGELRMRSGELHFERSSSPVLASMECKHSRRKAAPEPMHFQPLESCFK